TLTGRSFFPHLIADPFRHGLAIAFGASIVMLLIAAVASQMRGERFVHADAMAGQPVAATADTAEAGGPRHESVAVAIAREAGGLDGIPDQDVAFADALTDQGATRLSR
ncbi:MAG: hypothetical protein ABI418_07965, partial [Jatrophihabitantaceae bacterium]